MAKDETVKSVLSYQNAVALMVHLHRTGGSSKAVFLVDVIGNYNSVKSVGAKLQGEGLITITEVPGRSRYILYELTDRGRSVAQHLDAAERVRSGEPVSASMPMDYGTSTKQGDKING